MTDQRWTLKNAFAHFGAKASNPRWSWSAYSVDGNTVVITLWDDNIHDDGNKITVDLFGDRRLPLWQKRRGNADRVKNLAIAEDRCGGLFRVVRVTAHDQTAEPRSLKKLYPHPTLVMRLIKLDRNTGEFSAESVVR